MSLLCIISIYHYKNKLIKTMPKSKRINTVYDYLLIALLLEFALARLISVSRYFHILIVPHYFYGVNIVNAMYEYIMSAVIINI